jgi:hypothetical protein
MHYIRCENEDKQKWLLSSIWDLWVLMLLVLDVALCTVKVLEEPTGRPQLHSRNMALTYTRAVGSFRT